jgi:hypothetical protein
MTLHRRSFPLRLAVLAALALVIATPGAAQDTTIVPTPTLLRRIAEALDGNRTGERMWVVACRDSTNQVRAVTADRDRARSVALRLGPCYHAFGPFLTVADRLAGGVLPGGCQHDGRHSMMEGICALGRLIPLDSVEGMTLLIHRRGGVTERFPMRPTVDAIFLTLPAIDKFVIPYYSRVIGIDSAATMRRLMVRGIAGTEAPSATGPQRSP